MATARYVWHQAAGTLTLDGAIVSRGYAGRNRGKNNPALQGVKGIGPIPRGLWRMISIGTSPNTGPNTIVLHAVDSTPDDDREDTTGRGAFRIHGDSIAHPGEASDGCIILPRDARLALWRSGERLISVVA